MTTLYELTGQFLEVSRMVDDPDVPPEAIADTLEGIQGTIEDKGVALMKVEKSLVGDTAALDTEIKRLQGRKKTIENRRNWLRKYLLDNMAATDITKIECPFFVITRAKGREIVSVDDQAKIPAKFMTKPKPPAPAPIKADILKALKAGDKVPGCSLVRSAESLRVK